MSSQRSEEGNLTGLQMVLYDIQVPTKDGEAAIALQPHSGQPCRTEVRGQPTNKQTVECSFYPGQMAGDMNLY